MEIFVQGLTNLEQGLGADGFGKILRLGCDRAPGAFRVLGQHKLSGWVYICCTWYNGKPQLVSALEKRSCLVRSRLSCLLAQCFLGLTTRNFVERQKKNLVYPHYARRWRDMTCLRFCIAASLAEDIFAYFNFGLAEV